ncbi:conserved protein of unknown function [Burkholderia multivorans]
MGPVLPLQKADYSTMTRVGTLRITSSEDGVTIVAENFEFAETLTCREKAARVVAWARDLLAAQAELERLVAGGGASVILGG